MVILGAAINKRGGAARNPRKAALSKRERALRATRRGRRIIVSDSKNVYARFIDAAERSRKY